MTIESDVYLSIIAPLHDDSDIVQGFVAELSATLSGRFANYEVVLVDDGSTDDTVARVTELLEEHGRLRIIRLSRRFGQEIAISAGLDSVIGDVVIVMLPDSDPPGLVPQMVEKTKSGAEMIFGIRKSRKGDPLFLRLGSGFFYWYCNRVLRLDLPRDSTHFRAMSRRVVNALTRIKDRGRYLRTLSQHVGYRSLGFPYELVERRKRPRRKSFLEALDLAVNIVVTNSLRPLRMVSSVAVLFAAANAIYAAIALLTGGFLSGSLPTAVSFVVLFSILAVLCEYVGRVVDEGKGRPLYHVMEEISGSAPLLEERRRNVVAESDAP